MVIGALLIGEERVGQPERTRELRAHLNVSQGLVAPELETGVAPILTEIKVHCKILENRMFSFMYVDWELQFDLST